jgi:diguanylate cyclase (GGDEF)-like protein
VTSYGLISELTRWIGQQARSGEPLAARRARNLISGAFLGCGVALGFLALLVLPGWDVTHRPALIVIGAVGIAGALSQMMFAASVPVAMNHVTSVAGTAAIAAAQVLAGDPVAVASLGFLYVWVATLTAVYYSARVTAVHVAVTVAAQVAVIGWLREPAIIPQVVVTVGTCVFVATIVTWLAHGLRQELSIDPLTNLTNRRGLNERLVRDLAASDRDDRPLAVAALDLDGFKELNDRHGHAAGDAALIAAADAWRRTLRPEDTLARIGGDEFIALLPHCDSGAAEQVISRMLAATPAGISCSVGIAIYDGRQDAAGVLASADDAMYRNKTRTRDAPVIDIHTPQDHSPA